MCGRLGPGRRALRGYTLAELILVLLITGILAVVAVPRLLDTSQFAGRGTRDFIATALRDAQKAAIAMRRNVCVAIGSAGLAVSHASASGNAQACAAANSMTNPVNGLPYSDAANAYLGGASVGSAASVIFDALGRPLSSAGVPSTSTLSISVSGNNRAITVEPETGLVR